MELTQALLKELFEYDQGEGVLIRKVGRRGKAKKGDIVGAKHNAGYLTVGIGGTNYLCHRMIWLHQFGYEPKSIDHINHDRSDNRLSNLREVSQQENLRNQTLSASNTSGVTGVSWNKALSNWRARIVVDYVTINLGSFVEFHEAVNARKNAEILYNFHENHGKGDCHRRHI